MRRKSGNENALQEYLGRGEVGRLRSPVLRKNKSRPKIEVFSFVQPARPKHRKCEDGSRKYEGKGEGLTNCTHKSKPERKKTK